MKAIPVPPRATSLISFPVSYAKLPKIEKIVKPAKRLVPVSAKLTIVESLWNGTNAYYFGYLIESSNKMMNSIITYKCDDGRNYN